MLASLSALGLDLEGGSVARNGLEDIGPPDPVAVHRLVRNRLLPEIQGHNLAVTVSYVPSSLDGGSDKVQAKTEEQRQALVPSTPPTPYNLNSEPENPQYKILGP